MHSLKVTALRLANAVAGAPLRRTLVQADFHRNLWQLTHKAAPLSGNSTTKLLQNAAAFKAQALPVCSAHSKAESKLVEFLADEIAAERKTQDAIPKTLDGFAVKADEAEVELTKNVGGERITIAFNVNHTVDSDEEPETASVAAGGSEDLVSRPEFTIDIVRGHTTLSFTCTIFDANGIQEGEADDVFGISEFCIYEHDHSEKVYAVTGSMLDPSLYDLLLSLLEEKGISSEFVTKLTQLSTNIEHGLYVNLLEKLSKFSSSSA